jgi:hypothetical protein
MKKLEQRLYILPNADKSWHESWGPRGSRGLLNLPWPFRLALMARPNSGKSNFIFNLILQAEPTYEKIILIHPDENSIEYKRVNAEVRQTVPDPEEWSELTNKAEIKTLCIIDDIELKLLDKKQRSNLDRLFGYVSTHCGVSVVITSQDGYSIPVTVRRNLNVYVFWKSPDTLAVAGLIKKAGLTKEHVIKIFKELLKSRFDSFMVDLTANSPAMYRLNGFNQIPESFFD